MCEKRITLHTLHFTLVLLRFPVLPVGAAALAELRELETASGRLLVLGGCVVALFALSALQCHDFPHLRILTDSVRICSAPVFSDF
jgi:hypothetical protein